MVDLSCFGFLSSLQVMQIDSFPRANAGVLVSDMFGIVTPDAPILALLASSLGLKVGLVSNNVGMDAKGREITRLLAEYGIQSTVASHQECKTPQTVVLWDRTGGRTWFSYLPNVLDGLSSADLSLMGSCKLAYVDLYAVIRQASMGAIRESMARMTPLFINLGGDSLAPEDAFALSEGNVAIVQTSWDGQSDIEPKALATRLKDMTGAEIVLVTMASRGALCLAQSSMMYVPAYKLATIHSNGAGAAFSAGIGCGYLQGWDLVRTLSFASALGGLFCTVPNGFGLFSVDHILAFMQENQSLQPSILA